ncbi:hypothetical protein PBCV1_a307R [Paramecium bursaria Chlorella virus 1]|uniref:Uncharacterized protein n=1 Tax=Paramecium bursaria Chlorella virus 1 TaxID=10506 RepID=O41020_PBCV1|nr:hypothetical protein PBCV1_a307R [Paramecium bursaria Chlorella virus 1]AAC97067.2 hypothetical protein [Paramecium bursaria Chlorella virus 1]
MLVCDPMKTYSKSLRNPKKYTHRELADLVIESNLAKYGMKWQAPRSCSQTILLDHLRVTDILLFLPLLRMYILLPFVS